MASKFSAWRRNGRLATVALGIVFSTWLGFQIIDSPADRPPFLNELLYMMSGAWLANIAVAQDRRERDITIIAPPPEEPGDDR